MSTKITYEDKINVIPRDVHNEEFWAEDANEIKKAVNENAEEIDLHIADKTNPHEVNANDVGLGNVDNTPDSQKPISIPQQQAINNSIANKADLNPSTGKLLTSQIPAGIDEIIPGTYVNPTEFLDEDNNVVVPEKGIIYYDLATDTDYRWTGTIFRAVPKEIRNKTSELVNDGEDGKKPFAIVGETKLSEFDNDLDINLDDLNDVEATNNSVYVAADLDALDSVKGDRNVGLGFNTFSDGAGDDNVCVGYGAGNGTGTDLAVMANRNVMIGKSSGDDMKGADDNVMIGFETGKKNQWGDRNILIGSGVDNEAIADSDKLNIGNTIKGDLATNKIGFNGITPEEAIHTKGVVRHETENEHSTWNIGVADFYDDSNVAGQYYHIKLPYLRQQSPPYTNNGGQAHWHVHIIGSSNGSDTAIDLRYMGFLFSPNGIFNNSETIEHNNPNVGKGVLGSGVYFSPNDGAIVLWFQLEGSNLTRFRVDSMRAGSTTSYLLSSGEVQIIATTDAQI